MTILSTLKKTIEGMPKYHHVEILSILKSDSSISINENNNGTFINLSELEESMISRVQEYVSYIEEQQKQLSIIEKEKLRLEKTFFNNRTDQDNKAVSDDKDNNGGKDNKDTI